MSATVTLAGRAQRILDEVRGVRALSGVDDRAMTFLHDLVGKDVRIGSEKQRKWLADIERKVFGEAGE